MADTRDDLHLFLIPNEDGTTVGVQHFYCYFYNGLEYLVEGDSADNLFIT